MIGNLRNVDQAINARNDLRERAKRRHADNLRRHLAANRIIAAQDLPGVVLHLLIAERNLAFLRIERLDIDFDLIAYRNNLRGVLNAVPRELGDMNHAVHTADIDKSAVGTIVRTVPV